LFSPKEYRDIILESLKFCVQKKGLEVFAYVIMSNHIHLLARSNIVDLSGTIRDFKSFTGKKFIAVIESEKESRKDWLLTVFKYHAKYKKEQNHQIWTHENHADYIYSQKFLEQKIKYIHENPVRSGIVEHAEDYLYSSARNYADRDYLFEVVKVDLLWKTVK
jgi:putative transposase